MCLFQTFMVKYLCDFCNGMGAIDDGQGTYRNLNDVCPGCNGKGFYLKQLDYYSKGGIIIYDGKKG